MFKKTAVIYLFLLNILFCFSDESAHYILSKADEKRSPSYNEYKSEFEIITIENKTVTEHNKLRVFIKKDNEQYSSIAFFETPASQKGRKMLMVGTDTWLYVPGSRNPVRISASQKLSGNASTGDILSVNYSNDYTPVIIGYETINDIETVKLELTASKTGVTYYKIILWIDKNSYKSVKAEYYTRSMKLLKTGYFRKYEIYNGKEICTEILIADGISNDKITIIKNSGFTKTALKTAYFQHELLKDLNL